MTALAVALRDVATPPVRAAAHRVLGELGIDLRADLGQLDRTGLARRLAGSVRQAARLLGESTGRTAQDWDGAVAGYAGATRDVARVLLDRGLPVMRGLAESLSGPGARVLEVGAGVGDLAAELVARWPRLTAMSVESVPQESVPQESVSQPRPARVPAGAVAASRDGATGSAHGADGVHAVDGAHSADGAYNADGVLRAGGAATPAAGAAGDGVAASPIAGQAFDLVWFRPPAGSREAVRAALQRAARVVRPGGWLALGHTEPAPDAGDDRDDAISGFKAAASADAVIDRDEAHRLLADADLSDVADLPAAAGAPAVTVGRRRAAPSPRRPLD
ncbi:hypothetical protein GCM10011594_26320 [Nakamurella endophytica]|uniref:Uncharacterized protein n=2 Tax=Nakamurella endophytica TaxID=1748367 RepID=A0A917WH81_9ACTN|nr:hypothetical protein GCM10011594_26320 [Nakamurella endophytica]